MINFDSGVRTGRGGGCERRGVVDCRRDDPRSNATPAQCQPGDSSVL
jgi:hypothetical protein